MMYNIIGLAGPAGSGKDTVAEMIQRMYGYKRTAFAHTLKNMLAIAGMPEPEREFKEALLPGLPFSWRQAAQTLGTEWGRSLDPDLWVKLTMMNMEKHPGNYVISDVRFENETAAIREKGGTVVHIHGRRAVMLGDTIKHASEVPLVIHPDDLSVPNAGDLRLLQDWVIVLMSKLLYRKIK
jgi:hypothetical protein